MVVSTKYVYYNNIIYRVVTDYFESVNLYSVTLFENDKIHYQADFLTWWEANEETHVICSRTQDFLDA